MDGIQIDHGPTDPTSASEALAHPLSAPAPGTAADPKASHLVTVTTFPDHRTQSATRIKGTFDEVVHKLGLRAPPIFEAKAVCPMFLFAEIGGARSPHGALKHNGNIGQLYGVIGDYDDGGLPIDEACQLLRALDVNAVLYTSASHSADAPRYRILAPLSEPVTLDRYPAMVERLDAILGRKLDPSSYKPAQGFYYGRVQGTPYEYRETNGARYLDEIEGNFDPPPLSRTPPTPPHGPAAAAVETVDEITMADIEAAVMALPGAYSTDYGLWMKVALALKSLVLAGQEERASELWHRFSARDSRYDFGEAQRKWDGATPTDITHHSIFKWAWDAGWSGVKVGPRRRFSVVQAANYAAGRPLQWIIKGVLPKAGLGVVFGASGSGKSFMVMDMLANIARGEPWREHRVNKARVVYVAAEGEAGVRLRLQALAQHRKIGLAELELGVISDQPNLLTDEDADALAEALSDFKADLIVIDTLAQAMPGGDENSSKDMGGLLERARRIHARTGAMVVLIHHAGKDAGKGARGWSGLRAAADFEAEVSRDGEARALKLTKLKDGNDGVSFGFKLKQVDLGLDEDGDLLSSCVIEHVDAVKAPHKPTGKWRLAVYNAATELTRNGKVPATQIIDRVVERFPVVAGTRDRRRELAERALGDLAGSGWLRAHGELIGDDF